jgi:hypothetical protein
MLASTSDRMMTPDARKMARSGAGKGVPSAKVSGMVRTPARVEAPRTPAGHGGDEPPVRATIGAFLPRTEKRQSERGPNPCEAQRRERCHDRQDIGTQPPWVAMAGQQHRLSGTADDTRQLLAQQHEDDAVERELKRVQYRIAAHARRWLATP